MNAQRIRSLRPQFVVPALLAAGIAAVFAAIIIADSGSTDNGGATGGSGGGGRPSARLMAVLESLPGYPGAVVYQEPVTTGLELATAFWVPDPPQEVMAFYNQRLPALGWRPEGAPNNVIGEPKDDGSRSESLRRTFVKDDLRLTVNTGRNTKDPERGAGRLGIDIRPK